MKNHRFLGRFGRFSHGSGAKNRCRLSQAHGQALSHILKESIVEGEKPGIQWEDIAI